ESGTTHGCRHRRRARRGERGMRGVGDQHRGAELDGRRGTTGDRDRGEWVAEHRAREPQRRESRRLRLLRLLDDALDGGRAGAEPDPHPSMIARPHTLWRTATLIFECPRTPKWRGWR